MNRKKKALGLFGAVLKRTLHITGKLQTYTKYQENILKLTLAILLLMMMSKKNS